MMKGMWGSLIPSTGDILRSRRCRSLVSSERAGTGDGRVYTIGVQATNVNGLRSSVATTTVEVPHDEGGASRCPAPSPDQLLPDGDPLCSFDGGDPPPPAASDSSGGARSSGCSTMPGASNGSCIAIFLALAFCLRRVRRGAS